MWIVLHTSYNNDEVTIQTEHIASITARDDGGSMITFACGDGLAVRESVEKVKRKLEEAVLYY